MSFVKKFLAELTSPKIEAQAPSTNDDAIALISEGVIIIGADFKITFLNEAASRMTGRWDTAALNITIDQVVDLEQQSQRVHLGEALAKMKSTDFETCSGNLFGFGEYDLIDLAGGRRRVRISLGKIGTHHEEPSQEYAVCIVLQDISELHRVEKAMQRMAGFESAGILAAGVAHDFNSLLTVLMTSIDLILESANDPRTLKERLSIARDATWRGKLIAGQLLNLTKGGETSQSLVSPGQLLRGICNIAACGAEIDFDLEVDNRLRLLAGNEAQLNQLMLNLLLNAGQAMPEGGKVTISAVNIEREDVPEDLPASQRWWLKISVQDRGAGIDEGDLENIFEPFFSTKETGSGLGLAMVASIVKNHKGTITVKPRTGGGTVFDVYLPSADEFEETLAGTLESDLTGKGRILVMDDDAVVRKMIRDALTLLGYRVDCCSDGVQAVRMYSTARQADLGYDVVMLDLTIVGGQGGKKAIKQLLEADPNVIAIACSGYPTDPVFSRWQDFGFRAALEKPFDIHQLGAKIQEVLGERSDETA